MIRVIDAMGHDMSSIEDANNLRFALLTTRVVQAFHRLHDREELSEKYRTSISRAEKLLDEMISGSAWISGQGALRYSADTIPVAHRAISTLNKLERASNHEVVQTSLQTIKHSLEKLQGSWEVSSLKQNEFHFVMKFFEILSQESSQEATERSFGSGFWG